MPTYVSLINWTDQGIKNFRDTIRGPRTSGASSKRTAARFVRFFVRFFGHSASTTSLESSTSRTTRPPPPRCFSISAVVGSAG